MPVLVNGSEIVLSGTVGDFWLGEYFTNTDVVLALAQVGGDADVTIRLNSGGGVATEGVAIHSTIAAHKGRTTVVVEGFAASAASVLAMAGDEVVMRLGATMMVHEPANMTWGTADDHQKRIAELNAIGDSTAAIYARKTGRSVSKLRSEMKAELWLTADEAVEQGFADRSESGTTSEARQAAEVPPFDYRRYQHAPQQLVMLAAQQNWTLKASAPPPRSTASTTPETGEADMATDKERADALAAELDAIKATAKAHETELATLRQEKADRERRDAIMALPEAEGRAEQAEALVKAGVTAEAAKAVLMAAPKAAPPQPVEEPQTYERTRMAAGAGLNGGTPPKKGDLAILKASVDRTNARR